MNRAPGWVIDLLGLWLHQDMQAMRDSLDCHSVSDLFSRRLVGEAAEPEPEDVTGFSNAELAAMIEAVEWLRAAHPAHWQALQRKMRPWTRTAERGDSRLANEGAGMLAEFVDNFMKEKGF